MAELIPWLVGALLLAVWLGLIAKSLRSPAWMILGILGLLIVLYVAAGLLQSAAGPAASWDHGASAEERAGGRGLAADLSFILMVNVVVATPIFVLLVLITGAYMGLQAVRHSLR